MGELAKYGVFTDELKLIGRSGYPTSISFIHCVHQRPVRAGLRTVGHLLVQLLCFLRGSEIELC
jgi:hypothetical protein